MGDIKEKVLLDDGKTEVAEFVLPEQTGMDGLLEFYKDLGWNPETGYVDSSKVLLNKNTLEKLQIRVNLGLEIVDKGPANGFDVPDDKVWLKRDWIVPNEVIEGNKGQEGISLEKTTEEKKMAKKFVVVDNEFNQSNYKDLIGKIYEADKIPAYVNVKIIDENEKQAYEADKENKDINDTAFYTNTNDKVKIVENGEQSESTTFNPTYKEELGRTVNHTKCSIDSEIDIELYKNVCQNWPQVKLCRRIACQYFPLISDSWQILPHLVSETKIASVDEKIIITADARENIVTIDGHEIKITGSSYGSKLKNLRDSLLDKVGTERISEIINGIVKTASPEEKPEDENSIQETVVDNIDDFDQVADAMKNWYSSTEEEQEEIVDNVLGLMSRMFFGKMGNVRVATKTLEQDRFYYVVAREHSGKLEEGLLENLTEYEDKSMVATVKLASGEKIFVLPERIIQAVKLCKNYRRDTDTCRTGCEEEGVKKGDICPFEVESGEQEVCICFV